MFKTMMTLKRRPGMSRAEFIDYYENRHVMLARELVPGIDVYRRNYIVEDHSLLAATAGQSSPHAIESPFDVITEAIYPDQAAAEAVFALTRNGDIGRRIMEDEARFIEPGSLRHYFVEVHQSPIP